MAPNQKISTKTYETFRPSRLSIPPSRQPPLSPLTTVQRRRSSSTTESARKSPVGACPPQTPLPWLWQCHVCRRSYPLGVTRRCLDDGHLFCAGDSLVSTKATRRGRKGNKADKMTRKRGPACSSEFDYNGWKTWANWRRNELELRQGMSGQEPDVATRKSCADSCDYPSECRWSGRRESNATADAAMSSVATESAQKIDIDQKCTLETVTETKAEQCDDRQSTSDNDSYGFWDSIIDGTPASPSARESSSCHREAISDQADTTIRLYRLVVRTERNTRKRSLQESGEVEDGLSFDAMDVDEA